MEKWQDVKGYEGFYEVSTCGRVRSLDRIDSMGRLKEGRILKQKTNKSGYKECHLYVDGKGRTHRVHKLVAMTFIPNEDNLPQINHKDEIKTHNNIENLEWCTAKYNTNYGDARKKNLEAQNCIRVVQYSKEGEKIGEYYSLKEASRRTGIHDACISKVIAGKTKQAGGYYWRRA